MGSQSNALSHPAAAERRAWFQERRRADTLRAARECGWRWAARVADPLQFDRLAAFADPGPPLRGPFDSRPMAPWDHADHLAAAALGRRVSAAASMRFWARDVRLPGELTAELGDTDFLEAFLDAALAVRDEAE